MSPVPATPSPPPARPVVGWGVVRGALAVAAVALLAVAVLRRPGWVVEALEAARQAGVAGRLLFALAYAVAALLMLPASPLTVGAGHAFGPWVGVLVAAPATTLAACLPFLLGRTLLRPLALRWLARRPDAALLAEALRRSGLQVVALLRLSPLVPFPLLNYLVGTTPLALRDFALGSFLGMLPGTIVYAWLGSLLPDARQAGGGPGSLAVLGLLAALTAVAALLARRALRRALAEARASR